MANLITLFRLVTAFYLAAVVVHGPVVLQWANAPLLLFTVALDGVDGMVARARGQTSHFGSIFDVMADRVVESLLWLTLAYMRIVPVWAAIIVLGRSIIVDGIRYPQMGVRHGGFDVMHTSTGRWVVAGRFMRGAYGTLKAATFALLLLIQPAMAAQPEWWARASSWLTPLATTLVWLTVAVCVVRGLPVVAEWVQVLRRAERRTSP